MLLLNMIVMTCWAATMCMLVNACVCNGGDERVARNQCGWCGDIISVYIVIVLFVVVVYDVGVWLCLLDGVGCVCYIWYVLWMSFMHTNNIMMSNIMQSNRCIKNYDCMYVIAVGITVVSNINKSVCIPWNMYVLVLIRITMNTIIEILKHVLTYNTNINIHNSINKWTWNWYS